MMHATLLAFKPFRPLAGILVGEGSRIGQAYIARQKLKQRCHVVSEDGASHMYLAIRMNGVADVTLKLRRRARLVWKNEKELR